MMPSTRSSSSSKRKLDDFVNASSSPHPLRPKLELPEKTSATLKLHSPDIKANSSGIDMDATRYQQPKLTIEQDEVVVRKYYPAEMSNARAEMYRSGKLPKPIDQLEEALRCTAETRSKIPVNDAVVHWFRGDLRVFDNTALHLASQKAQSSGATLISLFLVSPQDYEAHIKSPSRVDFILRTLEVLRNDLDKLDIPLWVEVIEDRNDMANRVLSLMQQWNANHIYGNMEYEVDELRRDARIVKVAARKKIDFNVVHDIMIAPPGALVTKSTGKPFTIFTPWFKAWVAYLSENPKYLDLHPPPHKNSNITRERYKNLFSCPIPPCPEAKKLDTRELNYVRSTWPAGEQEASMRLGKFLDTKITDYKDKRDFPGGNGTSVLSVHFATGTLSSRTAINRAREANGQGGLNSGNKGITCWISEVGWREFYRNVLINFPWVW